MSRKATTSSLGKDRLRDRPPIVAGSKYGSIREYDRVSDVGSRAGAGCY